MKSFRRLSISEQTTAHLRERLRSGQWGGHLPGVMRLCAEMQVSQTTLRAALCQLEAEGFITPGGRCRSRCVVAVPADGRCGWASCCLTGGLRDNRVRHP